MGEDQDVGKKFAAARWESTFYNRSTNHAFLVRSKSPIFFELNKSADSAPTMSSPFDLDDVCHIPYAVERGFQTIKTCFPHSFTYDRSINGPP